MSDSIERVLVVDDEPNMRKVLCALLERSGYEVLSAGDGREAQKCLQRGGIDVVMTDIRMPRMNGLELLAWCSTEVPDLPVIVITAHGTIDTAVQAMKDGAFDFVTKPFDSGQLIRTVRKARDHARALRSLIHAGDDPAQIKILGHSEGATELRNWITKVADLPANIVLSGEPGTGHEVVAQAVHEASERRHGPFVKINCGAIPKDWVESELFGHEADAIAGAVSARPGTAIVVPRINAIESRSAFAVFKRYRLCAARKRAWWNCRLCVASRSGSSNKALSRSSILSSAAISASDACRAASPAAVPSNASRIAYSSITD